MVDVYSVQIFDTDHTSSHISALISAYLTTNSLEWWLYETKTFLLYDSHKSFLVTPQGLVPMLQDECKVGMA